MDDIKLPYKQKAKFNDQTKTVTITGPCVLTGVTYVVTITYDEFERFYIKKMHAQRAMPNRLAEEREFLISGVSPKGWDELFTNED